MRDFAYTRPHQEDEAAALASQPGTVAIAGGTELLNWIRLGIAKPDRLVDLGALPGRAEIAREGDELLIGGLADLNRVGEHPQVQEHARLLSEACLAAASAQVRNRATLGGNVLQRTRCPYFRAEEPLPWGCNKRVPGSGCAARHGINDEHAIFGWTDECVATNPSDPLVALVCLDATAELISTGGSRTVPVRDLHLTQREAAGRGEDPARRETTLAAGELIAGYRIALDPGAGSAYVKVRVRQSYAYALVSAAATVRVEEGAIAGAKIALGSVAQRPWRLQGAEAELLGSELDEASVSRAIGRELELAEPLAANGYKVELARNAATRALMTAASR